MVTPAGLIKVLDFGLAAVSRPAAPPGEDSPTLTMGMTEAGMIMGTAAYMAPEQASGQPVDRRADIWSFGVVLHELLTGDRLFIGETTAHILAAVIHKDPDFERVPANVRPLLKRCLQKDPRKRLQSIGDWDALLQASTDAPAPAPTVIRKPVGWIAAAATLLAGLTTLAFIHFREQPTVVDPMQFEIVPPEGQTFSGLFSLSRDGRNLLYLATDADGVQRIWARPLNSTQSKALTEADRFSGRRPDSNLFAFQLKGKSLVVDVGTGVISQDTGATGKGPGSPNRTFGGLEVTNLAALPGSQHFVGHSSTGGKSVIVAGLLDGTEPPKVLRDVASQTNFAYYPVPGEAAGYLFFMEDASLLAQRFDPAKLALTGDAVTVVAGVARRGAGVGLFSVADNGLLAYRAGNRQRTATWFNRQGKALSVLPDGQAAIELAPGDAKAAFTGDGRITLVDLRSNTAGQFTFDPARSRNAIWSPDGKQIVFSSEVKGKDDLYTKPADGSQAEQPLLQSDQNKVANDWSRDGRYLVYQTQDPKTGWHLWVMDLTNGRKTARFSKSDFNEVRGQISPDGRWLAYTSNESGAYEVYVRSFPDGNGKWLVSRGLGDQARWRPDGRELFYRASEGIFSVDVSVGTAFQASAPKILFPINTPGPGGGSNAYYDVTADGQRFLMTTFAAESITGPIHVIVNWQEELRRRQPVAK